MIVGLTVVAFGTSAPELFVSIMGAVKGSTGLVLGNVIGFLTLARLPDFKGLKHHDPMCTGDRFGIVATCTAGEQDGLIAFFEKQGGEGKVLEKKEETGSP